MAADVFLIFIIYRDKKDPSFLLKATLGMTAGAVGSFVGNPTEVALIRMTSDGHLPASERRNYKNVFDAISRIYREEGVVALWRVIFLLKNNTSYCLKIEFGILNIKN